MKKLLIYYSFILTSIMMVSGFLSATEYAHLISAVLFAPLAIYFLKVILPRKRRALVISTPEKIEEVSATPQLEKIKNKVEKPIKLQRHFDADRRMFLKLVGSAGLSIFLLAIFTRKAHGAFFGSVPGPGTVALKDTTGTQIDPARHHPTEGYKISRLDDSSPAYYGFTNKDGAWFIMKEDSSGNYTYATGASSFTTSWAVRNSVPPTGPTYGEYFDQF